MGTATGATTGAHPIFSIVVPQWELPHLLRNCHLPKHEFNIRTANIFGYTCVTVTGPALQKNVCSWLDASY